MHILFGGSFDPVHSGHLASAEAVRQLLQASCVTLLPTARSPLKPEVTANHHRLAMLRAALVDYPALAIDERELRRPPPSYTVDTLREVRAELGNTAPLVWVIGADTLHNLPQWKDWQALTQLAHLLVIERPGYRIPCTISADACSPQERVVAEWLQTQTLAANSDQLQCRASGLWLRLALPPQPFSSTDIRQQLAQRGSTTPKPAGLPAPVWQYILDHQLYAPDESTDTQ